MVSISLYLSAYDFRTSYEVVFNKRESKSRKKKKKGGGGEEEEVDGPVVERKCPKCGHERMSYAALQLRLGLVAGRHYDNAPQVKLIQMLVKVLRNLSTPFQVGGRGADRVLHVPEVQVQGERELVV